MLGLVKPWFSGESLQGYTCAETEALISSQLGSVTYKVLAGTGNWLISSVQIPQVSWTASRPDRCGEAELIHFIHSYATSHWRLHQLRYDFAHKKMEWRCEWCNNTLCDTFCFPRGCSFRVHQGYLAQAKRDHCSTIVNFRLDFTDDRLQQFQSKETEQI